MKSISTLTKPGQRHALLVAHGSRLEASNDEIRQLVARLRAMLPEFQRVECAFLEAAAPSIPEGLRQCIATGASEIVVMPYFLSAGRHVRTDIPEQVASITQQFPDIAIRVTDHIGGNSAMLRLLVGQLCGEPIA